MFAFLGLHYGLLNGLIASFNYSEDKYCYTIISIIILSDTGPRLPRSAMVIIEVKAMCQKAGDRHEMMAFLDQNPKLYTDSNRFQCSRENYH